MAKTTRLIMLLCMPVVGAAADLCPQPPHVEGRRWIAESAITEARANEEMARLQAILAAGPNSADSEAWQSAFVYVQGWLLKRDALDAQRRRSPGASVADFCDFMKTEAYVRH